MSKRGVMQTRVLLVCAAIAVATGVLGGIEGWLTIPVLAAAPFLYGFLLGVHALPGIIAQELFRMPWVALLTHVLAGLVGAAIAPVYVPQFLGTALLFGAIQEGVAAIFRYRAWSWWRYLISALLIGGVIAFVVAMAADLDELPGWAQALYLALSLLGPVAWTLVGLWVARGLERAGITPGAHRSAVR
ncbi:ECF transporter S component [Microbacterium sediminis]|uniref:ECF transporter S component n=1 Tax=Microbacterium sediminis TaxID=904291 RepID=UPI001072CDDC|nr:ECF transporter S component [Microbacterium sediminis]QBR73263.1 acyl esterase [Microbacterium sediminis]